MRRFSFIVFPFLAAFLAAGCGNPYRQVVSPDADGGGIQAGPGGGKKGTEMLDNKDDWATFEGQIVFEGALPSNKPANISKDKEVCLCADAVKRGEENELVWTGDKVGSDTGLENVVVFLKPPAGKHFKIFEKYKNVSGDASLGKPILDQPFCAYEPRVTVLYPGYSDGKAIIKSGQVFEVKNSATIIHNTKIKGDPLYNSDKVETIGPGSKAIVKLEPQETPLGITCDVHPWMTGYAWAFGHPYFFRTDKYGKFKIENVPAGVELSVVVWHEGLQFYSGDGFDGKQGKKMTFTKDKTETLQLKVKK